MKNSQARTAEITRETRETQISISLNLDGTGARDISTSIPFLDHMLELFARHSLIDLKVRAKGDREVDDHHLVEDLGIVLGDCIDRALGDRRGIRRYGFFILPIDEALTRVALDLSGRPYLVYSIKNDRDFVGQFDIRLVEEFFRSVCNQVKMNLHILNEYGDENHHIVESVFKAFARAMRMAVEHDPRDEGIPSSKGII
ncbi:MAG: imidazoleglycerol-phosphate dehydratase HisB [Kiritimatiellae bacterium]|nr:imidazoleglycerol-phosphate dehydratase HisB [Kiritimatiellia bacterium]